MSSSESLAVSITIGTPDSARMIRQTSMPGQLGQHQVEQHEVRALGAEAGQRLAAVGRRDDPESVGFERVDQRLAQGGLVVDDEDRSCHSRLMIRTRVNAAFSSRRRRCAGALPDQPAPPSRAGSSLKYSTNSVQRPSPSKRSVQRL